MRQASTSGMSVKSGRYRIAAAKAGEAVASCDTFDGFDKRVVRAVRVEIIIERLVVVRRISSMGGSGF